MYNANLIVNSPLMMAGVFRCKDCHMTFQSQHLLTKHKMKFCVGSTGDPDDLQLRRGLRSTSPARIISPLSVKPTEADRDVDNTDKRRADSDLLNRKLDQLRKIKEQRSRHRDLNDLEERMLLDKLEELDHQIDRTPGGAVSRARMPLSKHKEVRDLQLEYEQLRDQEESAGAPVRMESSRAERKTPYSRNSNSSMSIYLDDDYRRNPNQDQQLRSLAENHGRQMEYLQLRNRDLEKQREDIRKRLEGLGRKSVAPAPDNTADLLRELREQEGRNQRALDDLRRQLMDHNNQKVNVMDVEILSRNVKRTINMITEVEKKHIESQEKHIESQDKHIESQDEQYFPNSHVPEVSKYFEIQESLPESRDKAKTELNPKKTIKSPRENRKLIKQHAEVADNGNKLTDTTHETRASIHAETLCKTTKTMLPYDTENKDETEKTKNEIILSPAASPLLRNIEQVHDATGNVESSKLDNLTKLIQQKAKMIETLKKGVTVRGRIDPSSYSEIEKPVYPQPVPPPQAPPYQPEPKKQNLIFPVYYGKSLVAEISAIRQAYLQNGGNDPDVLAQMAQMLAEAQAIEDAANQRPERRSPREKPKDNQAALTMLEMENERLIQELRILQDQKMLVGRNNSDKEDELERELRRLQRDHLEKMYGLQKELDDLRMMLMMERNRPIPIPAPAPAPQPQQIQVHQAAQPPVSLKPYVEVEPMAPYDQYAGFVIFYDFILSLDPTVQACRLVVGLHSSSAVMGEPTVLPTVYSEPATRGERYNYNYSNAVIGAKQPVPKCPPEADLGIVVELQASGGPASEHDRHSLITRAWTKVPLFDNVGKLIAGRFRIPLRNVPIKPFLHVSQVQKVQKYGDAELYYRIVNMREAEIHSMHQISAANYNQYTHPQWQVEAPVPVYSPKSHIPPPPTASPLPTPRKTRQGSLPERRSLTSVPRGLPTPEDKLPDIRHRPRHSTSPPQIMSLQDMTLGFQVDRCKFAEPGEGKVRLTAYYASTGKVVQSGTSAVTCSTTAVRSNFKFGYHVFGQQEASFQEVDFQGDMVLIARFYLKKRNSDIMDEFVMPEQGGQEPSLYDEETLVAWGTVHLVACDENLPLKKRRIFNPNTMAINQGTHTIKLYQPPVPEPNQVPYDDQRLTRNWEPYGKAQLRIYIFQGQPRPGSLTPSDMSDLDDEETLPEFAWLPLERKIAPTDPFLLGDGFDIYIDGCRYLPDSATFTKVAGRILDRRYDVYGKDINTGVKLDSDVYNPIYEEKIEFRETNIPPTSTLLLKIYTIDNFYKTLTVVGYCTLNVFVETGTERQPTVDRPMQVTLNEGAHQLRLYGAGPNGVDPLTETCLRDGGVRIIPCATILIRIVKITRGPGGKALEQSKVPKGDWLRMGLFQPRPKYSDRVYYSSKCMPTRGETRLFHSMMRRTRRSIREVIALVASAKESFLRSDKNMEEYIRNQLTKATDSKPLDQDLNFICQYSPKNGIKVAVDSAVNLPWSNFTHAHMCLNPPAAFYMGAPHATYDKLTFTELLDIRSTNTSPAWKDGFKHFPRRSYHRFMTMIIHLQEISVSVAKENYKYGLMEQAWTAVQIFTDKYCTTQAYQLPLFYGAPSQTILKQLAREPCKEWMERNIRNNGIRILEGTSIFVRIADARRDDELVSDISHNKLVEVNTDYIPVGLEENYARERPGKPLETLVPLGKTPDQFIENLKIKFKSLVYKLYEEGNINN